MNKKKKNSAAAENAWSRLTQEKTRSLGFIFFVTFLAFSNIFGNQFVLDDFDFIARWPLIQDMRNFPRFFVGYIPPDGQPGVYSPLKTFWHALNFQLWGADQVFGHHLAALLIHAAGIWAVYHLSYELLRRRRLAFWTALLFALHPVHVEAITFMTASIDTLGIVFLFASFYFHLRANRREGRFPVFWKDIVSGYESKPGKKRRDEPDGPQNARSLSILFAVMAVFTHELAISLPLLIVFYERFFVRPRRTWRELVSLAWPFFMMVAFYIFCKWRVLGMINRGGYVAQSFGLTMAVIAKAWAKYLAVLVFPFHLSHNPVIAPGIFAFDQSDFNQPAVLSQSLTDGYTLRALAVLGLLGVWSFLCRKRRPLVAFCAGWLFISLLPGANIVPSSVYFAERYLYPGSFSFCLLAASFIVFSLEAAADRRWLKMAAIGGVTLLVVFYGGRTWQRNRDWRDNRRVYEAVVRMNPGSAFMHSNLGIVYAQEGEWDLALNAFQTAAALKPQEAHFYFVMAPVYLEKGLLDQAISSYQKAIVLNPSFAEAYFNLAGVYAQRGNENETRNNLNQSIWLFKQQGRILEAGILLQNIESILQAEQGSRRDMLSQGAL